MNYYGAKDMAESFRTVRRNTLQIAQDIPEDKYGFKRDGGVDERRRGARPRRRATLWSVRAHAVDKKTTITFEDFGAYMARTPRSEKALTAKGPAHRRADEKWRRVRGVSRDA